MMSKTPSLRLINVIAASLDGKIAHHPRESDGSRLAAGFTNAADKRFLLQEISQADALIMGAETLRASPRLIEQKNARGSYPLWCIITRKGLEADLAFWQQTHLKRLIVSPQALPSTPYQPSSTLEYLAIPGDEKTFTSTVLERLAKQGCKRVLLLGGGQINRLFYAANKVDELKLTLCPLIVGRSDAPEFVAPVLPRTHTLTLIDSTAADSYLFLHYLVQGRSHNKG